jgi:glucose-1-phosphate cytidylyltransferase
MSTEDIPVVIFCGGEGTRMRGGTLTKKELVEIGGRPIIWHVMRIFSAHGFNRFVLPLGYEAGQLRRYFLDYEAMTRDFTIRLGSSSGADPLPNPLPGGEGMPIPRPVGGVRGGSAVGGEKDPLPNPLPRGEGMRRIAFRGPEQHPEWEVSLVDTGLKTDKAGRIARVADYLTADRFFVTYGDGVGDVDIRALLAFHRAHGKLVTITAIQPQHYQYGTMDAGDDGRVSGYVQYPELPYWINAGFMLFEQATLAWMGGGDAQALETGVLQELIAAGQVMMYRHHGFWQSMDTLKDANDLERLWQRGAPWQIW